ncbi:MAG TPA: SpoIIE family protein phosphatase [Silvibacterium sp.]|nr:SpoIIE family protein phosphatase [Silvibacterium sp.]
MPDSAPAPHGFSLLLSHDGKETRIAAHAPFTIGRSPDMDLVLPFPYISRHHAQIEFEPSLKRLELVSSGNECFVNGVRVKRQLLSPGDHIRLGFLQGPLLSIYESADTTASLKTTLDHLKEPSGANADLAKLSWFVEAARRLNDVGAVQQILEALIDTTLELTRVERGFVFLRGPAGEMSLAAGRSHGAETLGDISTLSNTAIRQAIEGGSDFIVTDTLSAEAAVPTHSIVAQSIRAIICIPLRTRPTENDMKDSHVLGVLYLDSRQQRSRLTRLDNDLLRTIATEATLLVQNATLAQAEAAARRYREELLIASEIQQGLMSVRIPALPFAQVAAQSIPCKGIGGDFYDVLCHGADLYVVVADISGKGVSAAVLGSTLQGLIHGQILSGLPLTDIALFANRYICDKNISKYATLLLLRLTPEGTIEYVNCGHVQPVLHLSDGEAPDAFAEGIGCNLPVGLFADATYVSEVLRMKTGQRLFVLTDGMTEAEDTKGQCFGDGHLQSVIASGAPLGRIFDELKHFASGAELEDDCTMVEVRYGSRDPKEM